MWYSQRVPIVTAKQGRLYVMTLVGEYEAGEMIDRFLEIVDSADLPEHARIVLDMRKSQSLLKRSISDMKRITGTFTRNAHLFDRRVALVVEGLARYGLMRMAAVWVERDGATAAVFRDMDEARRWALESPAPRVVTDGP